MKQTVYITRHSLSSLFEKTLKLLKPTWKPSLITCAIVYVPVAILSIFFFQGYFSLLMDFVNLSQNDSSDWAGMLMKLLPFLAFVIIYSAIVSIASAYATAVVSRNAFKAASGESAGWKELMGEVFRAKFGKLFVFLLLQGLIIAGAVLAVCIVIALLAVLVSLGKAVVLAVILIIILYLGIILAMVAVQSIFQFGPTIIANEEISGGGAIVRCFKLIKGEFWRVIGISMLFSIALSFATSLITMPLQFASIAPMYIKILESAMSGSSPDSTELLMEMSSAFKGMGVFIGLLFAAQYVIMGLVNPLFTTLFYVDLRVRKTELADAAEFSDLSGQA